MIQPATVLDTTGKISMAKDTRYRKIFVGGLPYHTTDDSLREYFAVFGDIEEAVVITERQTGKSKGYGFVTMTEAASAERACKDPNPIIDGRKANVNLAYIGAKPRNNVTAGFRPVTGALLPVAPHIASPYPFLYQTQAGHYLSQSPAIIAPPTGYPTALMPDVTGTGNLQNAYSNYYAGTSFQSTPAIPSAYILPTIPTQPAAGIQMAAIPSVPTSGFTYATVAPATSEAQQSAAIVTGSNQPTYAQLVAQLQQQATDRH